MNPDIYYLREWFKEYSGISKERIAKLDEGAKPTEKEIEKINSWAKSELPFYLTLNEQEEKTVREIEKLYDMTDQTEDAKKYILNLLTDWFAEIKPLEVSREINITPEMKEQIEKIKGMYDWKNLNPWLYSIASEYMIDPKEKKSKGVFYTNRNMVHKAIDPLFLNDLTERVDEAIKLKDFKKMRELRKEMGSLTFLDPACGSGNFLFETYIALRKLENRLIEAQYERHMEWMALFNHLAGLKVGEDGD